jgi:hypothetical protein
MSTQEEFPYGTDIKNKDDKFDVNEFNKVFEETKEKRKQKIKQMEEDRIYELNKAQTTKQIYQLSLSEILIGIKDTWFELIDDILQKNVSFTTFTKNNRLFFIGLTIIIIILFVYLIDSLVGSDKESDNKNKIEIHHIYKMDNQAMQQIPNLPEIPPNMMQQQIPNLQELPQIPTKNIDEL